MIRSSRIPPLLNKVCTDGILSCYLITSDGELLGCSDAHLSRDTAITAYKNSDHQPSSWDIMDPNDVSALVAEVVDDYKRLGFELSLLNTAQYQGGSGSNIGSTSPSLETVSGTATHSSSSSAKHASEKARGRLNCLIVEMEKGLIGIATATASTYVVALTDSTAQHGYLKMKLTSLANYVRDSFSPLEDSSVVA